MLLEDTELTSMTDSSAISGVIRPDAPMVAYRENVCSDNAEKADSGYQPNAYGTVLIVSRKARVHRAGSSWPQIAETTATPWAPACSGSRQLSN